MFFDGMFTAVYFYVSHVLAHTFQFLRTKTKKFLWRKQFCKKEYGMRDCPRALPRRCRGL